MRKDGWKTFRLGDIAENISVRVDDPATSELDRFVGLEHLDSGSVYVKRWGSTMNYSSGKSFQSGDVLLCRRRPYLRKCSEANFGGVCSGDAYVLREKHDFIVPGLLKYILNTEEFWEYAISNSDGSMSARVKFRDLEKYSVTLPPKRKQDEILEILNNCSAMNRSKKNVNLNTSIVYQKLLSELFDIELRRKIWKDNGSPLGDSEIIRLADIAEISFSNVDKKSRDGEEAALLCNYMDVYSNDYISKDIDFMQSTAKDAQIDKFSLEEGDILATKDSETPDDIGVPAIVRGLSLEVICGYHLAIIRTTNDRVFNAFLFHYMKSNFVKSYFKMMAQGSTRFALGKEAFESLPVPIPKLEKQHYYSNILDSLLSVISTTKRETDLQNGLLEKLLGGDMSELQ
jgi:type I restriction enzyme, S subunit